MKAYYNDNDPNAVAWLKDLVGRKLLPKGDVDDRPIQSIRGKDLDGYKQCHFFAGIGGWPLALQLARWPREREVWTGSCPCQPFSNSGQRKGYSDRRHLWPHFLGLIRERRPAVVMGEQVSGALGYAWLDRVESDLEQTGYQCEATDIPACTVNAPHSRQRLYWVAYADGERRDGREKGFKQDISQPDECDTAGVASWDALRKELGSLSSSHGLSEKLVQTIIHGYGNAVVPALAAEVIRAWMETH